MYYYCSICVIFFINLYSASCSKLKDIYPVRRTWNVMHHYEMIPSFSNELDKIIVTFG